MGADGTAKGEMYLDDGISVIQKGVTHVNFAFEGGTFSMSGTYGFDAGVQIASITFIGLDMKVKGGEVDGEEVGGWMQDGDEDGGGDVVVRVGKAITGDFTVVVRN